MARSLGHALRTALVRDGPPREADIEGPSLGNARRRLVFRYLCVRPCVPVGRVARELGMSPATVRWHESDLVSKGYLDVAGSRVFPRGLLDSSDAELFALLADPGRAATLAAIYAEPGITVLGLASALGRTRQGVSKFGAELSREGLVTLTQDGRFRRHYPTDLLHRRREANGPRAKAFASAFVHHLQEDGLAPEVLRDAGGVLLVRFGPASARILFDLPLDPYATAWSPGL